MKTIVKVQEVEGEGLFALLGQNVTLYCGVYIYAGKLVGVNDTCVKLEDAKLVYDTGGHHTKSWATAENFPGAWYVSISAIESFGIFK